MSRIVRTIEPHATGRRADPVDHVDGRTGTGVIRAS